jgi:nucleotide-binding universal stress UspA family protein
MTILVGTDFSDRAKDALAYAGVMARTLGETLHVVNAADLDRDMEGWRILAETPDDIADALYEQHGEKLAELIEEVFGDGPRPQSIEHDVEIGSPAKVLMEKAAEVDAAMIVVGSVGESRLRELLLGSTARRLISRSEHPVLVVPPDASTSAPKQILAPVDFSPCSEVSLRTAAQIADIAKSKLYVTHCFLMPNPAVVFGLNDLATSITPEKLERERTSRLQKMVDKLGIDESVTEAEIRNASPDFGIIEAAEDFEVDLIVMGTHGRRGLSRFFIGNTAERILRDTPCPVLTVRPPADSGEEE